MFLKVCTLAVAVSVALFMQVAPATASDNAAVTPFRMLVQQNDEVHIRGFNGQVEFVTVPAARELTVGVVSAQPTAQTNAQTNAQTGGRSRTLVAKNPDWDFHFRRDGNKIIIAIDGNLSKQDWMSTVQGQNLPHYNIKVMAPALPVYVNWHEGVVRVAKLDARLQITALKAQVTIQGGEGDLIINNQDGEVNILGRKGQVKVDTYTAKVSIKDIDGGVELDNFTGDSVLQTVNGQVHLSSYKGNTKVSGVKGRIDFKNGQAPLHIEGLEGDLRGNSEQGPVFAEVRSGSDVHLTSLEGPINLRLPSSGAWVNLGTEGGNMAVPNFLKTTRLSNQQVRTGKLRGSGGGSVFVRTKTGDIRVR